MESGCELYRVIIGPKVHKEQPWLLGQHVTVECCHLDSIVREGLDDFVDLTAQEHKISRDGCFSSACGLKIDGGGHAHRGRHRHSGIGDLLGAWNAELQNSSIHFAGPVESLLDAFLVESQVCRGL